MKYLFFYLPIDFQLYCNTKHTHYIPAYFNLIMKLPLLNKFEIINKDIINAHMKYFINKCKKYLNKET